MHHKKGKFSLQWFNKLNNYKVVDKKRVGKKGALKSFSLIISEKKKVKN